MRRRFWKVACPRCGAEVGALCIGTADLLGHSRVHPERAQVADGQQSWWSIALQMLFLSFLVVCYGGFTIRALVWAALAWPGMALCVWLCLKLERYA